MEKGEYLELKWVESVHCPVSLRWGSSVSVLGKWIREKSSSRRMFRLKLQTVLLQSLACFGRQRQIVVEDVTLFKATL